MTGDLRSRIASALVTFGLDEGITYAGELAALTDAVVLALGGSETQWATRCNGVLFPAPEEKARLRARSAHPAHELLCRDIAVVRDWHSFTDPDADQAPAGHAANRGT
jgi:hypothetical protein